MKGSDPRKWTDITAEGTGILCSSWMIALLIVAFLSVSVLEIVAYILFVVLFVIIILIGG